jgi:predicted nucleic acid-binding protein
MKRYYDTGLILKLYTEEAESDAVRAEVVARAEPVLFTSLHLSECVSALRLKCFRKECLEEHAAAAILDIENDMASGVLRGAAIDWTEAWNQCRILSDAHAGTTGCRTLDALHVACAKLLGIREFCTSDVRQANLAKRAGLRLMPMRR